MTDQSKARQTAEARFEQAQQASRDARKAVAESEQERLAVERRTARLKALRLAQEDAAPKPLKSGRRQPAKKPARGIGSY